jgi:hypothetical protein
MRTPTGWFGLAPGYWPPRWWREESPTQAQLAAAATMSLTGRSLMAALAADVAVFVAARGSRKQAGV